LGAWSGSDASRVAIAFHLHLLIDHVICVRQKLKFVSEYRYTNLKKYNYVPGAQRSTNTTANVNVAEAIIRSIWVGNLLLCLCAAQQLAPAKCRNGSGPTNSRCPRDVRSSSATGMLHWDRASKSAASFFLATEGT
jgi:hypothetical protein